MSLGDTPALAGGIPYRTPAGLMLPPAGRVVAYVRATASVDDEAIVQTLRVPTLNAALAKCTSGRGDIIVVLPGHTENVTGANALSNLKAGTQIVGYGQGTSKPTFTWTATGSQWLIAVANVTISGLLLNFGGGADVTLGIDVTASDVAFVGNEVITAASSTSRATTVMRLSSGANRFLLTDNFFRGTNGANSCVDGILVNAAVSNMQIHRNIMEFGTTVVTVGNIRFATAAATELYGTYNTIYNTTASSTCCIDYDVTVTGVWAYNNLGTNDGATAPASSGFLGTLTGTRFFQNFCSTAGASGLLCPVADA